MFDETTVFGYEAEWGANYRPFLEHLHGLDLVPDPTPHRYHCDCDYCRDYSAYSRFPFRGQTDSSCDGELISGQMALTDPLRGRPYTTASELWRQIEEAALATDAEPGMHAGFHHHVSTATIGQQVREEGPRAAFRDFAASTLLLLGPLAEIYAGGRHGDLGSMNHDSVAMWQGQYQGYYDGPDDVDQITPRHVLRWREALGRESQWARGLLTAMLQTDRHGHVHWHTRLRTVEFRLWRSTRVAWRMELYALLTCALVSPRLHAAVLSYANRNPDMGWDDWIEANPLPRLIESLDDGSDPRVRTLLDLMAQQQDYWDRTQNGEIYIPASYQT